MKYSIGVDIGGTNIRLAVVDEEGNIISVNKQRTKKMSKPSDLVDQIVELYESVNASSYNVEGMGVGVPGPVKQSTGYVHVLSNIGLSDFNLKDMLEERLNIKVVVGNDAKAAALAEARLGAGKGEHVVQYVTISTGIGGGLVIDGNLYYSSNGFSQEIGNMNLIKNGRQPNPSMNPGCLEGQCSGTALVSIAKERGLDVIHAGEFFDEVNKGNEVAINLKEEWIENLAFSLGSLANILEPDVFVLGGGVMQSSDYFLDDLIKELNKYVFPQMRGKIRVEKAHFDQDAGIIGASLLVL
jgi:glucokinase